MKYIFFNIKNMLRRRIQIKMQLLYLNASLFSNATF